MSEYSFYQGLLIFWFALSVLIFFLLLFIAAPYGRHFHGGWGATIENNLGWILMEAPAAFAFLFFFIIGERKGLIEWLFLGLWEVHYIHRSFIYPLGLRSKGKRIPLAIVFMGAIFNLVNAYLNGRYLFTFSKGYALKWLISWRFLLGVSLFALGFAVNRQADHILRNLRRPGEKDYKIPYGGLYRWVSCPNYLGEIIEWIGWAIATWSLAGASFALWTFANLAPRAHTHHRWYQAHFDDYPPERKALVPRIW